MAIFESDIETEDLIRALPIFQGGLVIATPPAPLITRYIFLEQVDGDEIELDDEEIDLSTLEDLSETTIRRRLHIFRNGYKIVYRETFPTDTERGGFTIDFEDNKIILAYEAENEDFEIYLYPV